MNRVLTLMGALGLTVALAGSAAATENFRGPLGVLSKKAGVTDGYVLIDPQQSRTTWLIDNDGNVINQWTSEHKGFYAELLPNGNLSRQGRLIELDETGLVLFGGVSGIIEEFDWDGNKVWEYRMYTPGKEVSHHTYEVMPNGNYLLLGWEYKSYDEAIAKGLDPNYGGRCLFKDGLTSNKLHIDGIWPDFIREVDHDGKTVWEWHVWDHLGKGKDKFDINVFCPPSVAIRPTTAKARLRPVTPTTATSSCSDPTPPTGCPTAICPSSTTARVVPPATIPARWSSIPRPTKLCGSGDRARWAPTAAISIPITRTAPRSCPTATGC